MNNAQIDNLRDMAIEYLPRAQIVRKQANLYGDKGNYYRALYHIAVSVGGDFKVAAEEGVAAKILYVVCLLRNEDAWDESIPSSKRKDLLEELVMYAKELCMLTGRAIPWLEELPSTPLQESEAEGEKVEGKKEPPAALHKRIESIAGRFLTTREAAYWLSKTEQTLREWRTYDKGGVGSGDLNPFIPEGSNRLLWSGDEIISYLNKKKKKG